MGYPIKTLGQLRPILQGFRKAAGLTQAMMASHLGVTQQTYAQLEANPAAVSVERLFRVLRVLDVDLTLAQAAVRPLKGGSLAGSVPTSADSMPPAERIAAMQPANKGSAKAGGPVQRKTPGPHGRAAGALQQAGATPAGKGRGNTKANNERSARKKAGAGKKRESW